MLHFYEFLPPGALRELLIVNMRKYPHISSRGKEKGDVKVIKNEIKGKFEKKISSNVEKRTK